MDAYDPGPLVMVLFIVSVFRLIRIEEWVNADDPGSLVIVFFIVSVLYSSLSLCSGL